MPKFHIIAWQLNRHRWEVEADSAESAAALRDNAILGNVGHEVDSEPTGDWTNECVISPLRDNGTVDYDKEKWFGANQTTDFYPSPEVKAFGERLMSAMFDASVRKAGAGLGGCLEYRLEDFDEDLRPHIKRYIDNECNDSVAVCYAAMREFEHGRV